MARALAKQPNEQPTRIVLDKIASSTKIAQLSREVRLSADIAAAEGAVLAVRVRGSKAVYNLVEDTSGRMIPLDDGDLLAGVLGSRRALRGYAGVIPDKVEVGDMLDILNLGGVIGRCTSENPELGPPLKAEVLGAVLSFPFLGERRGVPATIRTGAIERAEVLESSAPVIYVAGTCMQAGKTRLCSELVRYLNKRGYRVCASKFTGVSLLRDTLSMMDRGAFKANSFSEAGVVSTRAEVVVPVSRGLLNDLNKEEPDVIVVELGDGILGEYGVQEILADPELMSVGVAHLLCAPDPVAAWGAVKLYRERFKLELLMVSGPATDNDIGKRFIEGELGVRALNARLEPAELGRVVVEAAGLGEPRRRVTHEIEPVPADAIGEHD